MRYKGATRALYRMMANVYTSRMYYLVNIATLVVELAQLYSADTNMLHKTHGSAEANRVRCTYTVNWLGMVYPTMSNIMVSNLRLLSMAATIGGEVSPSIASRYACKASDKTRMVELYVYIVSGGTYTADGYRHSTSALHNVIDLSLHGQ